MTQSDMDPEVILEESTSNSDTPTSVQYAIWRRFLNLVWTRWIERALENYTSGIDDKNLQNTFSESIKQTRIVFTLYLGVLSYGLLAVARMQDSDFYGLDASIKLPLIDLVVSPGIFFLAFPILVLILWIYLQVHLGHSLHLVRRLRKGAQPLDPDTLYPSLEAFGYYRGVSGAIARGIHASLVWVAISSIYLICWFRLLPLRSTITAWMSGSGIPASSAMAIFFLVAVLISLVWSGARATINRRLGLSDSQRYHLHITLSVCCFILSSIPLVLQRTFESYSRPVFLEKAVLSRPAGLAGVVGCRLSGLDLHDANLRGAYLEAADLSGANLSYADLSGANLRYAKLSNAKLYGANISSVNMEHANVDSADLSYALIFEANLKSIVLNQATVRNAICIESDLSNARLTGLKAELFLAVGSNFDGADLSGSTLYLASFRWDEMQNVSFSVSPILKRLKVATHAECVDFLASDLRSSMFSGVHLAGSLFTRTLLEGADFRNARAGYVQHNPAPELPDSVFVRARFDAESREEQDLRARFSSCSSPVALVSFDRPRAEAVCARHQLYDWRTFDSDSDCAKLQELTRSSLQEESKKETKTTGELPAWVGVEDRDEYSNFKLRAMLLHAQDMLQHEWNVYRVSGLGKMKEQINAYLTPDAAPDMTMPVTAFDMDDAALPSSFVNVDSQIGTYVDAGQLRD